jgi:hypothetical protein
VSYSLKSLLKMVGFGGLVLGLCLSLAAGLAGCGNGGKSTTTTLVTTTEPGTPSSVDGSGVPVALIGKWQSASLGETLEFTGDGKLIWTGKGKDPNQLTYTVEGDTIAIHIEATKQPRTLQFSIVGGALTTTDASSESVTYTRLQ